MELSKLEKYKKKYNSLKASISSLAKFIDEQHQKDNHLLQNTDYVAARLEIDETDLLFLLSLAQKENLINLQFCITNKDSHEPIIEVKDVKDAPAKLKEEVGPLANVHDYYLQPVFEVL